MSYNEADTRTKLIDPAIHRRGWTEDLIRREETAGPVEIIGGKARRRSRGKVDYILRVKVNVDTQPVALALIDAPLPEQQRIASILREQMATVEKARRAAEEELEAINALPPALLRRAFSGEL